MVVKARPLSGDKYLVAYGVRGCNQVTPTLEYVAKSARKLITGMICIAFVLGVYVSL
jgi:hypothetical protein